MFTPILLSLMPFLTQNGLLLLPFLLLGCGHSQSQGLGPLNSCLLHITALEGVLFKSIHHVASC